MDWLLDTNVISELRRPKPDAAVSQWVSEQRLEHLHTSAVCFAELRHGIESLADHEKSKALRLWLEDVVRPMFAARIIAVDEDILTAWRALADIANRAKRPAPAADLLIAASALKARLAVATRDVVPFADAGLAVLNPFTGERFNGA